MIESQSKMIIWTNMQNELKGYHKKMNKKLWFKVDGPNGWNWSRKWTVIWEGGSRHIEVDGSTMSKMAVIKPTGTLS